MSEPTLLDVAGRQMQTVALQWATYSVFGSFILYLLGYLTIRFHVTVLGVGTDLGVLDERYLFAGAKFVVYLASAVVTLCLLLLVPAAVGYAVYRFGPWRGRPMVQGSGSTFRRFYAWCSHPARILLLGIIMSIAVIQLLMKQCFYFGNLLVARNLPAEAPWLSALLVRKDELGISLFFTGLVGSVVVTAGLLLLAGRQSDGNRARFLFWLLAFLVAVELLLLPINYGALIADKVLPEVASLDGVTRLQQGEQAWLVWQGPSDVTYLVRRATERPPIRSLVTLGRTDVKRTEIIGYENILWEIFGQK